MEESSSKEQTTSIPLYAITEETATSLANDNDADDDWDTATNLPNTPPSTTTCCHCLFRALLHLATVLLGALTLVFAIFTAPFAMVYGRGPSKLTLKHAIREYGGRFINWGDRNNHVQEYFVYGSKDPNADVLLLYAGAFSPGDVWKHLSGDQSADVWGTLMGLKVICPTNPGLGCSSYQRIIHKKDVVQMALRILTKEKVTGQFFVAGMSQGSHVAGIVADVLSERVKGVIFMCPYISLLKCHELFFKGKKCPPEAHLHEHPDTYRINMVNDLFPFNFVLHNALHVLLPVLRHSYCLWSAWEGFTRRSFGLTPDMQAATQRCDAEGHSDWIDQLVRGNGRGKQHNIYGEAHIVGFGNYANMAGKDGTTPVVVCTDMNENQIPDVLCSSRQSWWMVNNIPNAKLLTADMGYGHLTEYLFVHELMTAAMPVLRQEEEQRGHSASAGGMGDGSDAGSGAGPGGGGVVPPLSARSVGSTTFSRRSATSARTRFRRKREDIWRWTDPHTVQPPAIHKNSPIPWCIRRDSGSMYQKTMNDWVTMAYIAKLHFGGVFLTLLLGLFYSYSSFVVWGSVGIPTVVCVTGAVLLGPMLVVNLVVLARHSDPHSRLRTVMNSAQVIAQGGFVDDDATSHVVTHIGGGCSFEGCVMFVVWLMSNLVCVYYANVPLWLQSMHVLASLLFASVLVQLMGLMSTGRRAIFSASKEIVNRMRTWVPPLGEDALSGAHSHGNSLPMIAADISLFEESIVGGYSAFFGATVHSVLLSTFVFVAAVFVAVLEDQTWLDPSNKAGISVLGLLVGFAVLVVKVLSTISTTTSICAHIPLSTNRLRLRVVEAIDEAAVLGSDQGEQHRSRKMGSVSESVRTLCDGVLANPMGFRLSGVVVSPKMVMQGFYAVASVLFLVLAGGKRGM